MLRYIGMNVQNARLKAGLTQENLAEKVDISVSSVSRCETGRSMVSIAKLIVIANELHVPAYELMMNPEEAQNYASSDQYASSRANNQAFAEAMETDKELHQLVNTLSDSEKALLRDFLVFRQQNKAKK